MGQSPLQTSDDQIPGIVYLGSIANQDPIVESGTSDPADAGAFADEQRRSNIRSDVSIIEHVPSMSAPLVDQQLEPARPQSKKSCREFVGSPLATIDGQLEFAIVDVWIACVADVSCSSIALEKSQSKESYR